MPQMAPLLWLNLYLFFTIVFVLIIIMNFYMKPTMKISAPIKKTTFHPQTWKW
uniref:ATP synthase F0 subunit 8 n=1 Tax=Palaemon australis TaxID=179142 RepID=UPI00300359C2|nr:ATP synthase F0 subunit 8 [Palaemon australis]